MIVLRSQMLSPTLVQFVWDYAKSGALVCPFSLMPKECSLALDFFGFGGLDIVVADEDPGKLAKNFSYAAFKNTMKAVPGIIEHVNRELSSNKLAIGLHFIVSPPTPCWPQDTLMPFYKVTMPAGYKAIQLTCLPTTSSPRCFPESSYDILAPETENAADARGAVLAGVLALGTGIQAKWSKPRLKVCDVGEYGNHEFEYAKCYVLEVTVEPAGCDGAPSQGILSFVPEEDGQDAPKSKSKRKRKD
jgi:hypothetical protein